MKIPEFKSSEVFIREARIPCMVAAGRNSSLPRIAVRHNADHNEDPEFAIYLRGANARAVSGWQMEALHRLFELEEISANIERGMEALEVGVYGKFEGDQEVELHGMLPFLWVIAIVIDDIRKEIIISLDTDRTFKPHESEMVIYSSGSGWEFDDGVYIDNYVADVAIDKFLRELGHQSLSGEENCGDPESKVITDPTVILGRWVFDQNSTSQLDKLRGFPGGGNKSGLFSWKGYTVEFAQSRYHVFTNWRLNPVGAALNLILRALMLTSGRRLPAYNEYVGCELRGTALNVQVKSPEGQKIESISYRLKQDKLVLMPELFVLSRTTQQKEED